ncbi:hypothetical protein JOL62DRAFT_357884 [Phyllosticta paracitricarpa]|uniref:Uncharacterized protein n=1 Tax=Phyllosticta paracitricarpa TaxID=2016321 RepID=A0ABR1NIV1_9PEZI
MYWVFLASSETGTRVDKGRRRGGGGLSMWRSHGTHPRLRSCFGFLFAAVAAASPFRRNRGERGSKMRERGHRLFESHSLCFPIILWPLFLPPPSLSPEPSSSAGLLSSALGPGPGHRVWNLGLRLELAAAGRRDVWSLAQGGAAAMMQLFWEDSSSF